MSIRATEILTVLNQNLPIFCQNLARVGINITAISGTVTFQGTFDGINWAPVYVAPFPAVPTSAQTVQTTTTTGNWVFEGRNFLAFRAQLTAGTSATVYLSAANDSSWQDAYLPANQRFVNAVASSSGTLTMTIAAQANRAYRVRTLVISASSVPNFSTSPAYQITDGPGGNVLWSGDLNNVAGSQTVPLPTDPNTPGVAGGGVVNSLGNALVIVVAAGAGMIRANAEIIPQ